MPSPNSRLGVLAGITIATLFVASILTEIPRIDLAGATVPTQFVVGAVAGLLTFAVAVSELRDDDYRSALQFGLLGAGVPLALSGWQPFASLGAALTLLSVPVAWRVDRWVRERVAGGAS